ncbi:helix-turn-helix domain-containing protein [Nonomuraea sp. GTA35]|uniref:helix-turn-helix domain-containing protein n=1 Tax=Nonomuraea sp. GTA35 TaxID=1676746 RepID=UPI0035C19513
MLADIGHIYQHAICHLAYLFGRHPWSSDASRGLKRAAAEFFAERGTRQRSSIDIADKAGVSRGSTSWHFGNKRGLLVAVLDDQLQTPPAGPPSGGAPDAGASAASGLGTWPPAAGTAACGCGNCEVDRVEERQDSHGR